MRVNIKKLTESARIPVRGSKHSAGYDLYSDRDGSIEPFTTEKIETNIAMEIPKGYFGAIYARSGLATKNGLRPANCVGVVDEDYRGNIIVALHNDSNIRQEISKGDRIAQLIIQPYSSIDFQEVEDLTETVRGEGGFGHTGIN